jgi:hypothetical protein
VNTVLHCSKQGVFGGVKSKIIGVKVLKTLSRLRKSEIFVSIPLNDDYIRVCTYFEKQIKNIFGNIQFVSLYNGCSNEKFIKLAMSF